MLLCRRVVRFWFLLVRRRLACCASISPCHIDYRSSSTLEQDERQLELEGAGQLDERRGVFEGEREGTRGFSEQPGSREDGGGGGGGGWDPGGQIINCWGG